MNAGIYCEPKNIDRHLNLGSDGMVYCQHCYRELKAENEKLRTFPRQKNKEGGWTISYDFIKRVEKKITPDEEFQVGMEEIENVLLALEQALKEDK
jgi:hypothetical protein